MWGITEKRKDHSFKCCDLIYLSRILFYEIGCRRPRSTYATILPLRQGSKELDSSCSRESSSPVMLSAAKHLAPGHDRSFAALRMTWGDGSRCHVRFVQIEPCLMFIIGHPSALTPATITYNLMQGNGCSTTYIPVQSVQPEPP